MGKSIFQPIRFVIHLGGAFMKKSFRLIGVLLAFVLAFSSLSAVALAADDVGKLRYSQNSGFTVTGDEAATMLLDYVDDLLADKNMVIKVSDYLKDVPGVLQNLITKDVKNLTIRLNSIDNALADITKAFEINQVKTIINTIGKDVKKLTVAPLKGVKRADGDLKVVYALFKFLNDNRGLVAKVAAGKGLDLGILNSFVDLNEIIEKELGKAAGQKGTRLSIPAFLTELVYKELLFKLANTEDGTAYAAIKKDDAKMSGANLDGVLNEFIKQYLTVPNKANKNKVVLPSLVSEIDNITVNSTAYDVIKRCIAAVYEDLGRVPLNNDFKEALCQMVGAKLVKLEGAALTEEIKGAAPGAGTAFATCDFYKLGEDYYLRKNQTFYKVDFSTANSLKDFINWDYSFEKGHYDFGAGYAANGDSLLNQINNLLGAIIKPNGGEGIFKLSVDWKTGENTLLKDNLHVFCKEFVKACPDTFFGVNMAEIKATADTADFQQLLNVVLRIILDTSVKGLTIPANTQSLPEIMAVVANHFAKKLSTTIDYSAQIMNADGIIAHTNEEWVDIVMNIGVDCAVFALDFFTTFDLDRAKVAEYKAKGWGYNEFLDEICDWAINYVGKGVFACFADINADQYKRGEYDESLNAWAKFNTLANALLPLEFINGVSSEKFVCDFELLFKEKFVPALLSFDLDTAFALFAKNDNAGNVLNQPFAAAVIGFVARIINSILPGTIKAEYTVSADKFISSASLGSLVDGLFSSLNSRVDKILPVIAPFVLSFLPEIVGQSRLTVKTGYDKENKLINVKTSITQKLAADLFGIQRKAVLAGSAEETALQEMGIIIAKTSDARQGITLDKVDGKKFVKAATKTAYMTSAKEDGTGKYFYNIKLTGLDAFTADKDLAVVSYVTYTSGKQSVTIYSDIVYLNIDFANVN